MVHMHDNWRLGGGQHGFDRWLRDSLGHLLLRLGFLVFGFLGGKLVLGLFPHGRGSFLFALQFLLNGLCDVLLDRLLVEAVFGVFLDVSFNSEK